MKAGSPIPAGQLAEFLPHVFDVSEAYGTPTHPTPGSVWAACAAARGTAVGTVSASKASGSVHVHRPSADAALCRTSGGGRNEGDRRSAGQRPSHAALPRLDALRIVVVDDYADWRTLLRSC